MEVNRISFEIKLSQLNYDKNRSKTILSECKPLSSAFITFLNQR